MFNFWKVDFGDSLVDLPCRQLEPETLYGKGPQFSYKGHNAEWAKDVKSAGNFRTVNLDDWIIVCPDMPKAFDEAFKFISKLKHYLHYYYFCFKRSAIISAGRCK